MALPLVGCGDSSGAGYEKVDGLFLALEVACIFLLREIKLLDVSF